MSTEATYTAEFHSGFRATLTVSFQGMRCEWRPDLPRNLAPADREALIESYRAWRNECLTEFAEANDLILVQTLRGNGLDCIAFRKREVTP